MPIVITVEKGVSANIHAPAAATAAVVTYAAVAGRQHVIDGLAYSYSAAPTGGNLKVEDGATTVFTVDIPAAGAGFIPVRLKGTINTALTVTLASGAGAVVGKVNVLSHWAE